MRGTFLFDKSNFIYLGHSSKIIVVCPRTLRLYCTEKILDLSKDMMLPGTTANILRNFDVFLDK